ncbi:biopolymer transporter ExbD [bacterium]|nr:biopolymer transporter ExbD [bacterium]
MRPSKYKSKVGFHLDPAPMTDVIFLLLIFFMLSSSFIVNQGIKIKLPKAIVSENQLQSNLVVTITKKNQIFLNAKKVSLENLPIQLKNALAKRKEKMLIIKADKDVLHGIVVQIMDIAKINGVEKLAIATEVKKDK